MRKAKVKRYEIGGDVDYARNENREGRVRLTQVTSKMPSVAGK